MGASLAMAANSGTLANSKENDFALTEHERWFVVHTLPKSENRARLHLTAQGFRTFYPQRIRTIRHARQTRTIRGPFFPRYLFVIINPGRDRWLSIKSTFGVSALITCNNLPVAVPAGVVEALIAGSEDRGVVRPRFDLKQGQRVQILSGPLYGLIGTLDRLDENGRVRILLEIMSGKIPAALKTSEIRPV
jgi:transcription elongation factor/antiterminator RfaH